MRGINQRELGRKERATAECERRIRRYGYECGEVLATLKMILGDGDFS